MKSSGKKAEITGGAMLLEKLRISMKQKGLKLRTRFLSFTPQEPRESQRVFCIPREDI